MITDLRQYGTVQRAVLGCSVIELDAKLAKEKKITAVKSGILISTVNERSTAKELGLEADDVITAINGVEVGTHPQLVEQLNKFRPGDTITVTYYRDNKKYTKSGTLRNTQGNTALAQKGDFASLGCAFMKVNQSTLDNLGISHGVQVTGLKSGLLKESGIKDGFIITSINDQDVNSSDDVELIYNSVMKTDSEDKVLFITGIYPTGKKMYYAVNLSQE